MKKDVLVIGGATGTGKSDVAVECALAMNGEVVSADSMQIYRGMDIGTAKMQKSEMKGVPHHMIDILSPNDPYTVAEYAKRAIECIEEIKIKGKLPILCGGTGLYINSVLYKMSFSGAYDAKLRDELQKELAEKGKEYMHEKLRAMDPEAAERLHLNDTKRVLRAIEKAVTGGTEEKDFEKPRYSYAMYLMQRPRDILYKRIDMRVDKMILKGLRTEVDTLLKEGVSYAAQSMQAIAYKEWSLGLSEQETIALIKKNTRNYAKRQITWFKQYKDAISVNAEEMKVSEIVSRIKKEIEEGKEE